jgi:polyhydroxyalkanoate synthesis repressor PhaR
MNDSIYKLRIIKKYANRRLYDTQTCRYITLEEVKQIVLTHTPFKVIDVKNKQDVTKNILLQIICELELMSSPIFTTQILKTLICFYDNPLQAQISSFLEKNLLFLNQVSDGTSGHFNSQTQAWMNQYASFLNSFKKSFNN